MKLLYDFFPILLFFAAYKFFGIYIATAIAIITTCLQVGYQWFRYKRCETIQIITLVLIVLLGGATLFLHNELFIKWKPTAINWLLGIIFLGSQFVSKEPFIQHLMQNQIRLSPSIWQRLNLSWVIFFFATGLANLYVAYHYDTNTWVNFKLFGLLGLTIGFIILQSIYLARHVKHEQ